jgi:hypothetical protein
MKKSISGLAVFILFASFISNAQTENDYLELTREVIKVEKKAAIAEVMELTENESVPFWNLYNEYQGKLYLIQNKRIAIIKDYAEHYDTLTDEKADELWTSTIAYSQELLKLKKSYYNKFKKILPAGKAALFFQTENKIETMINASLSIEIPLIETK